MLSSISIALCQFNATVGDLDGNTNKIISYIREAELNKVDLLIFPELSLSGYSPMDLLYYSGFTKSIDAHISKIIRNIKTSMCVIVGSPIVANEVLDRLDQRYYNSALVLSKEGIQLQVNKSLLPNYGIFQEKRQFISGLSTYGESVIDLFGIKIGIQVCEDMWSHLPIYDIGEYSSLETNITRRLVDQGAELIINISASPFEKKKSINRLQIVKSLTSQFNIPFIYVNEVGGLDEVIFDGRSIVCNSHGELIFATPPFKEGLYFFNSDQFIAENLEDEYLKVCSLDFEEELIQAITLNLSDYLRKIKFNNKLLIALSGGIDSALTASLCVNAVGKNRVIGISLPSKYSSEHSKSDARELAENLGIEFHAISIKDIHSQFNDSIGGIINISGDTLADENIQSRIRGDIMMYLSNLWGHILISTGNKSEIAVGYCTLYGDTAGGKNLIGDLYKTEVYALARYINKYHSEISIPLSTIEKPPSAELREDQRDSDSLPNYDTLDAILDLMIDTHLTSKQIVGFGYDYVTVEKISKLVRNSEFKRAQMVQSVKVTENAFGMGRIVPTATPFRP